MHCTANQRDAKSGKIATFIDKPKKCKLLLFSGKKTSSIKNWKRSRKTSRWVKLNTVAEKKKPGIRFSRKINSACSSKQANSRNNNTTWHRWRVVNIRGSGLDKKLTDDAVISLVNKLAILKSIAAPVTFRRHLYMKKYIRCSGSLYFNSAADANTFIVNFGGPQQIQFGRASVVFSPVTKPSRAEKKRRRIQESKSRQDAKTCDLSKAIEANKFNIERVAKVFTATYNETTKTMANELLGASKMLIKNFETLHVTAKAQQCQINAIRNKLNTAVEDKNRQITELHNIISAMKKSDVAAARQCTTEQKQMKLQSYDNNNQYVKDSMRLSFASACSSRCVTFFPIFFAFFLVDLGVPLIQVPLYGSLLCLDLVAKRLFRFISTVPISGMMDDLRREVKFQDQVNTKKMQS